VAKTPKTGSEGTSNGSHHPHAGRHGKPAASEVAALEEATVELALPPGTDVGLTQNANDNVLSPSQIFRGRKIFILGSTGFVGKVLLSMLLERFPDIARAYVMVRRGSGTSSEARFWKSIVTSPAFDPLRARHGGAEGLAAFIKDKVAVVDGDITEPNLGLSEEEAERVAKDIDVLINSSGRVTFNPPLESALRTNVEGTKNVIAFAKRMRRPALLHTSTCFVAGNRSGEVWESEELIGYFPQRAAMPGTKFSIEQEMADSERVAAAIRGEADDAQLQAKLRQQARERLREENRDPDDEGVLRLAVARERKEWIRAEATRRGVARAADWGWPNIYTYTKSMGDQLVAREEGVFRAIVRPAIVESSVTFPFPGWNEGFTTSAPLVYLGLKGQNMIPVAKDLILDVVPVDHICAGMLMVAAALCVEQPKMVYQLAGGDLNPSYVDRLVTLVGLNKRRRFQSREAGNKFINALAARMEARPVSWEEYDRKSIPLFNRIATRTSGALEKMRPSWGAGRLTEMIDRVRKKVDDAARVTAEAHENIALFKPFVMENKYIFRADNIRALRDRMPAEDRAKLCWGPEDLDWYEYWMNVHFPGLQKWVMPELEETYAAKPKQIYSYRDLLELFDTTTKLHATRPALRIERGSREDIYKYADLKELATRAGVFLRERNVEAGERVVLWAKNAPEWAMAYFGILKVGAVVVPIGHDLSVPEVVNIARSAGAVGIIVGDELLDKRANLVRAMGDAGLSTSLWPVSEVFTPLDLEIENERKKELVTKASPDALASLIFTSGTTGKPKGVMLTHRNFTFMVSELLKTFELGVNDGMLSVLPLHHTFEFATGLLVPLSRGAQITYLHDLTGDAIASALKKGRVTAIVGVPALWDLMKRRVLQKFGDKSPLLETVLKGLIRANFELRSNTGIDLGVLFFLPVHEGLGGRIRYLISDGSALSPDVFKTFYGLGFGFYEGYGLTETAPVLTVATPKGKPLSGSVGKPLHGVEVKIHEPDEHGVGEVIARGRNIMAGYWNDDEATQAVLKDGWFFTGDLGRFDEDGNLFIVGRSKDVIIDANGKNVYPDEIEDLYKDSPYIKELSVVGLPDGVAEHVACAVVPALDKHPELTPAEVKARIEEHFRKVSADLPFWKRVRTMHVWEGKELPRTAKRSVKRREVAAEMRKVEATDSTLGETVALHGEAGPHNAAWLIDLVAKASGKPRSDIQLRTRLADLGFDSIMNTELAIALESAGASLPDHVDFSGVADVAELLKMVSKDRHGGDAGERPVEEHRRKGDDEIHVPSAVAKAGKNALGLAQRLFYDGVLASNVTGKHHIPQHVNFLVAGNHCSHLDMGLVKVALGEQGRELTSLAAADYFFKDRVRRAYFENFTNLVPMERSGSIRKSMELAEDVLRSGKSMVVFPEGTRSRDGKLQPFLPSLGYLALRAGVGILPVYLGGTYEALPKGKAIPRTRDVAVAFGPFLAIDDLRELVEGLPQQEGWRLLSALTQRIVENLRDGLPNALDWKAIRAAWDGEALAPGGEQRARKLRLRARTGQPPKALT